MFAIALRLKPDQDPYQELKALVAEKHMKAGVILSLVGSFKKASIRFANKEKADLLEGPFEIVSATGTIGMAGQHIHVGIADKEGRMIGGHLSPGSLIFTTCEVVVLDLSNEWTFERVLDSETGYPELKPIR